MKQISVHLKFALKSVLRMLMSLLGHLSKKEKNISGERLILGSSQFLEPYPLSQCVIQVLAVKPQLFILCGLDKEGVSELISPLYTFCNCA